MKRLLIAFALLTPLSVDAASFDCQKAQAADSFDCQKAQERRLRMKRLSART
ncbi:hypothetical protein LTSESEN_3090 [Salmonella enterica subsp. enterica serovar Senftenberg str. A4-543]|uniref:Secreted protein n=1 Tax=Salmonella enterica subsp. enterica serovar Senftenberg str. A4-543 TaxID=913082 RepID=G5R1B3_SALSE|nr:hypothetical protein LTSESEN_3090 [Salmonella enterica subsp. enterica serovar Senftenberg str. A4-543]